MKWPAALYVNAFLCMFSLLSMAPLDAMAADEPLFAYPRALLQAAGIAPEAITRGRAKFETDAVHREWMQHVHAVLPGLDTRQQTAIVQIHTSFLYLKNALDKAYRKHQINQNVFSERVGLLFNWFQQAHLSVLSPAQSEALFGGPAAAEDKTDADASTDGPLGFPIENSTTTIEMIKAKLDAGTIEAIQGFHQHRKQEMAVIQKAHAEGSIPAQEFEHIKKELDINYINSCRDILTDEQFELLFGSAGN